MVRMFRGENKNVSNVLCAEFERDRFHAAFQFRMQDHGWQRILPIRIDFKKFRCRFHGTQNNRRDWQIKMCDGKKRRKWWKTFRARQPQSIIKQIFFFHIYMRLWNEILIPSFAWKMFWLPSPHFGSCCPNRWFIEMQISANRRNANICQMRMKAIEFPGNVR